DGDARILVAEETEPRRRELAGVADQRLEEGKALRHDAAAVEPHRGAERAPGGDQKRDAATEAEADDADACVVEAGAAEVLDGRVDVGDDAVVAHAREER